MACAAAAGIVLVIGGVHDAQPPQPSAAQGFAPPAATAPSQGFAELPASGRTPSAVIPAVQPLPPADPVRIRVPALKVDAPMMRLGLDRAGALRPPPADKANLAGWYGDGTAPGSTGTAITTGHVDTRTGSPGVFFGLGALAKGSVIEISRKDRRTALFTVDAVEFYSRKEFPSKKVYGRSELPQLRVITCGGRYAKKTGYQGNIVVYATLTEAR
ncbi:class F sortase [Streptomyces sp. HG99]|nr:class F sortase [Streptomyces sp. HG99]